MQQNSKGYGEQNVFGAVKCMTIIKACVFICSWRQVHYWNVGVLVFNHTYVMIRIHVHVSVSSRY